MTSFKINLGSQGFRRLRLYAGLAAGADEAILCFPFQLLFLMF